MTTDKTLLKAIKAIKLKGTVLNFTFNESEKNKTSKKLLSNNTRFTDAAVVTAVADLSHVVCFNLAQPAVRFNLLQPVHAFKHRLYLAKYNRHQSVAVSVAVWEFRYRTMVARVVVALLAVPHV